jgi:predicted nucleic acid-binding protein
MNVVDSSGWLEFFADGPNADTFAGPIGDTAGLVVPSIIIFDVVKRALQQRDEKAALVAAAHMRAGKVVDLDETIALAAAKISCDLRLPLADSVILATAGRHNATLWTQDEHFKGLPGVRYFPSRGKAGIR